VHPLPLWRRVGLGNAQKRFRVSSAAYPFLKGY
jgi:hypothetical protein